MAQQPSALRSVILFSVLACVFSWACMVPAFVVAETRGYVLPTPSTLGQLLKTGFEGRLHVAISLLGTLGSYGPAFAAIFVASREGGLRAWWKRCTRVRVGARGYRHLIMLLAVVYAPMVLIGLALGPRPTPASLATPLAFLIPIAILESLTAGMEEPGWRGYALPRLQEQMGSKRSALVVGLIWGLWHWPAFIPYFYMVLRQPGASPMAALLQAGVQSLLYALGSVLAGGFVEAWLYNRTGSAFINLLHHGIANALGAVLLALIPNPALATAYGIVRWILAIVLMQRFWKEPEGAPVTDGIPERGASA